MRRLGSGRRERKSWERVLLSRGGAQARGTVGGLKVRDSERSEEQIMPGPSRHLRRSGLRGAGGAADKRWNVLSWNVTGQSRSSSDDAVLLNAIQSFGAVSEEHSRYMRFSEREKK